MFGCTGAPVEVLIDWPGHSGVEGGDDPIALVPVNFDRREGLGWAFAEQVARDLPLEGYEPSS